MFSEAGRRAWRTIRLREALLRRVALVTVPMLLLAGVVAAVAHDAPSDTRVTASDGGLPASDEVEEPVVEVPSTVTTVPLPVEVPTVTVPKLPRLPALTVPKPTVPLTTTPGVPTCPATPPPFATSELGLYEVSTSDAGGRLVQRYQEPRYNQDHTYSPDGTRVAFVRVWLDNDGQTPSELYLANRDFGEERKIELEPLGPSGLEWSPDGRYVAFTAQPAPGEQQAVHLLDVAAGTVRQLSGNETMGIGGANWSSDGRLLAWASNSTGGLWVADVASSAVTKLADDPVVGLDWSPDDKQLVFGRVGGGVFVLDRDGSNRRQVHPSGLHVAWSPKVRSQLVVDTSGVLYRVDPDTGVSTFLRGAHLQGWLPDGSRIIAGSTDGIGLVDWNGCAQTVVAGNGTMTGLWAWTPDSRTFLVARFR